MHTDAPVVVSEDAEVSVSTVTLVIEVDVTFMDEDGGIISSSTRYRSKASSPPVRGNHQSQQCRLQSFRVCQYVFLHY